MARSLICYRSIPIPGAIVALLLGLSAPHASAADQPLADGVRTLLIKYHRPANDNPSEHWVFRADHGFLLGKLAARFGREIRYADEAPVSQAEVWQLDKPLTPHDAAALAQAIQAEDSAVEYASPNSVIAFDDGHTRRVVVEPTSNP